MQCSFQKKNCAMFIIFYMNIWNFYILSQSMLNLISFIIYFDVKLQTHVFSSFNVQVMHIASATEINSSFIPSLEKLHSTLHSKVRFQFFMKQDLLNILWFVNISFWCNYLQNCRWPNLFFWPWESVGKWYSWCI